MTNYVVRWRARPGFTPFMEDSGFPTLQEAKECAARWAQKWSGYITIAPTNGLEIEWNAPLHPSSVEGMALAAAHQQSWDALARARRTRAEARQTAMAGVLTKLYARFGWRGIANRCNTPRSTIKRYRLGKVPAIATAPIRRLFKLADIEIDEAAWQKDDGE